MGPDPAVAAVRLAVRSAGLPQDGGTVMVACSGGADSLALLAATVFELRRTSTRVVGAVVDHALQDGSGERTGSVVSQMAALGVDETASIRVTVDPGPAGIEAGAREARYAALSQLAEYFGATRVLLGHTVDDQAESVLLGLTQGSGPRSLVGMRDAFAADGGGAEPLFVRPLLRTVTRAQTEAACRAEDIDWWDDPHNTDPRFTRARIRHRVMPVLEKELGPGVARSLARTGHLMRDDLEALDAQAQAVRRELGGSGTLPLARLEQLDRALLSRVLRLAALDAGALPRDLAHGHVEALVDLVRERPGEAREVQLPGHLSAVRADGEIRFVATRRPDGPPVAG